MACTYERVNAGVTSEDKVCVNENCTHVRKHARALPLEKCACEVEEFSITLNISFVKKKCYLKKLHAVRTLQR